MFKNYSRSWASFELCAILFLWGIQIPLLGMGLPLFVLLLPISVVVLGYSIIEFFKSISILLIILSILLFQYTFGEISLVNPTKVYVGMLTLSIFIPRIAILLKVARDDNFVSLKKVVRLFITIQVFVMIIQLILTMLGLQAEQYRHYISGLFRTSGFFNEPSHVAIAISPLVFLFIWSPKSFLFEFGKVSLCSLILSVMICPSATLFVIILMSLVFLFTRNILRSELNRWTLVAIPLFLIVCIGSYQIENVRSRVNGVFENIGNITAGVVNGGTDYSAIVFLKGAEVTKNAINEFPLGVGFLNYGYLNDYSIIAARYKSVKMANVEDGSSMLFKLVGEFGWIGIVIILIVFSVFFIELTRMGKLSVIEISFVFLVCVSLVRGMTYFDGGVLVGFVTAAESLNRNRLRKLV